MMDNVIKIQSEKTVPVGYKHTEIGMIPEDWDVGPLAKHTLFVGSGKTNTKSKGDYPLFGSTGQIGSCLNPEYAGDAILIARVGANAGKLSFVSGQYGVSDNTIIVKLKPRNNIHFFKYWLTSQNLNSLVFGSGQPLITGTQLKELLLPAPSINEQTAIANVLSDIDVLITELEKLIAKKQAIKTATMQQLLSGRTRLTQFTKKSDGAFKGYKSSELGDIPEDWELEKIGSLLSITTGGKNTQDKIAEGNYPFFVRSQTVERINSFSFNCEGVLTAGDGVGTGKIFHYINGKFDLHQRVYLMFNFSDKLDGYFFYIFFSNNFYDRIMSMTAKSSVDSVRREMIADMVMLLPPKAEQIAIATILHDMDTELTALEQKLAKIRDIKQGMMQQLLTGRIRLPLDQHS
ncbi:TPA: restriction endonuclease subunit S [Klebsiella pneumoniae]|uniref:restriction endonuclease subunit S n=1 Tax=Klebsiella pneumoniae TaxID=573 RepID=UPI001ABCAF38|nr:restriction endonuclease subunit S [Klebsiella pneumoniae]HCI6706140.1 restriction endonuclease subunit S [Klebsiella pneumoniae]HCI7060862.1 restriction endonuclease subunit S [Klebsiella pneumoniae]HDU5605057.1 restriction endonuclease subunit S [Klebsiella pneumoniae subsp. ozaenae]HEH1453277.1 restriction endonuclease subunit S [Klebsiella pneumoniae]